MTSRQANISALIDRAKKELPRVEAEYQRSLHAKAIEPELRIDIKNLCENLRSALDYLAHDMRERHCPTAKASRRLYFPILPDQVTFDIQLDNSYPGLRTSSGALASFLNSVQPFMAGYEWLGTFNKVNNENKHGDLVEQTRTEMVETRVTGQGGGQVSWSPGVTFDTGVSIMGVPVDPRTQLPIPHESIKVERIIWVDFRFAGTNASVLALLRAAVPGVDGICATAGTHL